MENNIYPLYIYSNAYDAVSGKTKRDTEYTQCVASCTQYFLHRRKICIRIQQASAIFTSPSVCGPPADTEQQQSEQYDTRM